MGRKGFMAGCSLSSYSPIEVGKTVTYLKTVYEDISIIQKCCGKPTMLIGEVDNFNKRYENLIEDFRQCEIDEIIVACQNCYKIFKNSQEFKTVSLWELLPKIGLPKDMVGKAKDSDVVFSIHDSCPTRDCSEIHDGIRWILTELGYEFIDTKKSRNKTRCCGAGGMVGVVNPELATKVMERRVSDFNSKYVVTYCASCRQSMSIGGAKSWHILDLIFGPVVYKGATPPDDVLSKPIEAWKNRYKAKGEIKKALK